MYLTKRFGRMQFAHTGGLYKEHIQLIYKGFQASKAHINNWF